MPIYSDLGHSNPLVQWPRRENEATIEGGVGLVGMGKLTSGSFLRRISANRSTRACMFTGSSMSPPHRHAQTHNSFYSTGKCWEWLLHFTDFTIFEACSVLCVE